ncbi:hypothetical protein DKT69_32905 [Micromonospora sicca]|uniref:Uncharacterized protein n=1 Tax=Micromonospora sicca TaxID=2202420 RepID=A0A317D221_9ACTN|nr:hypothetical protein DKT69_32905 [Micromonospora sp. 4G51]
MRNGGPGHEAADPERPAGADVPAAERPPGADAPATAARRAQTGAAGAPDRAASAGPRPGTLSRHPVAVAVRRPPPRCQAGSGAVIAQRSWSRHAPSMKR